MKFRKGFALTSIERSRVVPLGEVLKVLCRTIQRVFPFQIGIQVETFSEAQNPKILKELLRNAKRIKGFKPKKISI